MISVSQHSMVSVLVYTVYDYFRSFNSFLLFLVPKRLLERKKEKASCHGVNYSLNCQLSSL